MIEEHFNRLEGKGEESMEKRTLAVQVTEELFQRVKWVVAKEGIKQKDLSSASSRKRWRGRSQMAGARAAGRNPRSKQNGGVYRRDC